MDKEKFSLLSNIKYPEDLRKLSIDELPELCRELREDIIEEVAVNPGHFASSLGVVEITVALHYIYNRLRRDSRDRQSQRCKPVAGCPHKPRSGAPWHCACVPGAGG